MWAPARANLRRFSSRIGDIGVSRIPINSGHLCLSATSATRWARPREIPLANDPAMPAEHGVQRPRGGDVNRMRSGPRDPNRCRGEFGLSGFRRARGCHEKPAHSPTPSPFHGQGPWKPRLSRPDGGRLSGHSRERLWQNGSQERCRNPRRPAEPAPLPRSTFPPLLGVSWLNHRGSIAAGH